MKYTRKYVYGHLNERISFSKGLLFLFGIITLVITAVSLIQPYLYKILVDDVMAAGNLSQMCVVISAMIVVYLLKLLLSGLSTYICKKFSYQTMIEMKSRLMHKFLERNISTATGKEIGIQSNNLEQDSDAVPTFLLSHLVGFVTSFLIVIVYMVLMLMINVNLGLLSVILLPLTLWFSLMLGKKYNAINKESYEVKSKTKTHLFNTVQKWREIKTNTLEEHFEHKYYVMLDPERKLNSKWIFYYALRDFFYGIKEELVIKVLIYFVGGLLIISKDMSIGELLMFVSYMTSMGAFLDTLMKSKTDFGGQRAVFERLFKILDEPDKVKGQDYPQNTTVYLQNIEFAYDGTERMVLEYASCKFENGKKYLLTGKSGEGKSTLIKLLLGIEQPQGGQILFGGIPAEKINSQDLLKNLSAVMQENMFFNLSIRENMEIVAPEATEGDIKDALKVACLYDFVESLPQKLDTVIGERGVKLSGGQKQRLAIARLVLHNPQIVILDEATGAIDPMVESKIMDNLGEVFRDKTMIVISHKPLVTFIKDKTYIIENKCITSAF